MTLQNKVTQFEEDSDWVRAWRNGPASGAGSTLSTDNGEVPTPAKLMADSAADIAATLANVNAALAQLQYSPPNILTLLIDGTASKTLEVGASLASAALSWTRSGAAPTSQNISNGGPPITANALAATLTGPFTTNQSWTLTASGASPDGTAVSDAATVSLAFLRKRYWGVSESSALDSAAILALGGSELSAARGKSITYDASGSSNGGKYLFYAYPASLDTGASALTATVAGSLFSDFSASTVSVTNASGAVADYTVVRFNGLQNGPSIGVVWA